MTIHRETVLDKDGDVELIGHELVEVSFSTWLLHNIKGLWCNVCFHLSMGFVNFRKKRRAE